MGIEDPQVDKQTQHKTATHLWIDPTTAWAQKVEPPLHQNSTHTTDEAACQATTRGLLEQGSCFYAGDAQQLLDPVGSDHPC